jgi:tRNA modification GTPase
LIRNKIDLTHRSPSCSENVAYVSALTGDGLMALKDNIKQLAGFRQVEDSQFLARQRHVDALNRAEEFLQNGLEQQSLYRAGELLADDLMSCQKALGEITGEVTSDELLGMIFSSFCIGK